MRIRESVLVEKLEQYLNNCDTDDLARIAGEAFDCDCYVSAKQNHYLESDNIIFELEPNGIICEELENLEEEE